MTELALPGMWSTVTRAGHQIDVGEPHQPHPAGLAVVFLHGHSGQTLTEHPRFAAELFRRGFRILCPHGGQFWWTWRVCSDFDPTLSPEAFLLNEVLPEFAERWGIAPPRIGLTGVSMGGQGALRLAYRKPRLFPVVAGISPAVDFQIWHGRGLPLDALYKSREACRQETATLELHPLNWPRNQLILCDPTDADWFEGVERLASKLTSTGIPFESDLTTRAGGHGWDYYNHMAPRVAEYLLSRLELELQRVG